MSQTRESLTDYTIAVFVRRFELSLAHEADKHAEGFEWRDRFTTQLMRREFVGEGESERSLTGGLLVEVGKG